MSGGATPALSAEGKQAQQGLLAGSRDLATAGTGLARTGDSWLARAAGTGQLGANELNTSASYYRSLLSGDRGSTAAALAPTVTSLTDLYRGASKGLDAKGVRGPQRDLAEAELARTKASQLGGAVLGMRPAAAQALTGIGTTRVGQGLQEAGLGAGLRQAGVGALQGSLGPLASIYGGEQNLRLARQAQNDQNASAIGGSFGNFLFDILRGGGGGGGKAVSGSLPFPGFAPVVKSSLG